MLRPLAKVERLEPRRLLSGGDFSLDFVASAPFTYDHSTGGGAFDDRTIGKALDVVESLEGGDFQCEDTVTYLVQIVVEDDAVGVQTIDLNFEFLSDATGQSGVGHDDITLVGVNYGAIPQHDIDGDGDLDVVGDGAGNTDSGNQDDGGSVATLISETLPSNPFHQGTTNLKGTVRITDLEAGEEVILRIDTHLGCLIDAVPTGNLQAAITSAKVSAPTVDTIQAGEQTVPFKQIGELAAPSIVVDKSGDTLGKIGDAADYTFTITNDGNVPLYPQSLTDTVLGALSASSFTESITNDNILQVGETWTLSTQRTVLSTDPDPLPNTFTAVFDMSAALNGGEASGSDSHSLNLFQPNFTISKTALDADGIVVVGDTTSYSISMTNTSSSDSPNMDAVSIIDTKIGAIAASAFTESITDDNVFQVGETWSGTFNYTVQAGDYPSFTNTVTAKFQVQDVPSAGFDGKNQLTKSASASLNVELPHVDGRMTGGGSIFLPTGAIGGPAGTRVTHGFQLHCTVEANNRLEINWGKPNSHFHLENLTTVKCEDTPLIQQPPDAPIDTLIATGVGRFSGTVGNKKYSKAAATIKIIFRDAGEPGTLDTASMKITLSNGVVVLNTDSNDADAIPDELHLIKGNHQAHYEIKRLTNAAATVQKQIDSVFGQLDNVSLTEDKALSLTVQLLDLFKQYEAALLV